VYFSITVAASSGVWKRWAQKRPSVQALGSKIVVFASSPSSHSSSQVCQALHPLSNRPSRSQIALKTLRHREGGPLDPGHGRFPGGAGVTEPPVTSRRGGPAQRPSPSRPPQRRPRGKGPRRPPLRRPERGKNLNWFYESGGRRKSAQSATSSDEL
jgi:hypothetical protein